MSIPFIVETGMPLRVKWSAIINELHLNNYLNPGLSQAGQDVCSTYKKIQMPEADHWGGIDPL